MLKVQLDPTGTWLVEKQQATQSPAVLLIGDSRVSQWSRFPPLDNTFIYGFSGFTSEQVKLSLKEVHIPSSVGIVIIQVGINDLKAIGLLEEKSTLIQQRVFANIVEISKNFLGKDIEVYVTTIIPAKKEVSFPRSLIWSDAIDESVELVNQQLRNLEVEGVNVIDAAELFDSQDQLYKDTLHFNKHGYKKLNQLINAKIQH